MTTHGEATCPHCTLALTVCICQPCQTSGCHGFHRGRTRHCDHCQAPAPGPVGESLSGAVGLAEADMARYGLTLQYGPVSAPVSVAPGCTWEDILTAYGLGHPLTPFWEALNAAIQEELDAMVTPAPALGIATFWTCRHGEPADGECPECDTDTEG